MCDFASIPVTRQARDEQERGNGGSEERLTQEEIC